MTTRNFTRLTNTSSGPDLTLGTRITLSGVFDISLKAYVASGATTGFLGDDVDSQSVIAAFANGSILVRETGASSFTTATGLWDFGQFNELRVTRNASNLVEVFINGVSAGTGTVSGNIFIKRLGDYSNLSVGMVGYLADVSISEAGTQTHFWAIDSDGTGATETDSVGTNDATRTAFLVDADTESFTINTATTPDQWEDDATGTIILPIHYPAAGDTTAPTFSVAPAVSSITTTGGTATATIDETGDIYYVVVADGATAPTSTEVIAGTGSGGTGQLATGSALATTTLSDAFSGLSSSTAYDVYFVARDDEGTPNVQASPTKVDFTTAAADVTSPTITSASIDTNGAFITINADENITAGAGGNGGFTLSTGQTLTYSSGDGTSSIVYSISPGVLTGATPTLAYTQPTNGWEDAAGNDLATFSGQAITNNSTLEDGYAVIILAGQSNMIGRAAIVGGVDDVYTGIGGAKQYGFNGQSIVDATNALDHNGEVAGDMGLWLEAVNDFVTNNTFDKPILLVPVAQGGTDIAAWQSPASNYTTAVARMNAALGTNANNTLEAFFWHQGETDASAATSTATYETGINQMRTDLIADITEFTVDTPFIVGHIKSGSGIQSRIDAINTALDSFSASLPKSAVVSTSDLTLQGDNLHFDAASLRTMGNRYATALESTQINTATFTLTGGASLTTLDYLLLDSQDLDTATILRQGAGETTTAGGVLEITWQGAGPANGQAVYGLVAANDASNGAMLKGTIVVS